MSLTTESLLIDRAGFGIVTASAAQRGICRILDGQPLGELASHPHVIELVGGIEALAALPSERGVMPIEVCVLAAIRTAKTIMACAAAVRMTQTVDVSRLGPGEVPRVSIVSLKLDTSAVPHRILAETFRASPLLAALMVDDTAEVITLRHPSGRPVEIAIVAGAKAGGGLVARWSAGVVFDEAPRMNGASDAVVNLDHARTAVIGRLLPGAQILYIGSPWAPHGPVYDLVQEHWTKPSDNFVVLRSTGPALNPQWWTPARCAKLESQDPVAYQTDILGEFADPESGLLNPAAVRRNERETPLELVPEIDAAYVAAVDPSEGAAAGNAQTLVIVQHLSEQDEANDAEPTPKYRVALAREWRGARPEQFWQEVSALCSRYGLQQAWSDQYAASANTDLARRYGLSLRVDKTTAASKLETYTNLATLIHTDAVELPPDRQFRRDLLSIRKRITQGGTTIVLPNTGDGRHADFCPSLVLALAHASKAFRRGDLTLLRQPGRYSDPAAFEVYERDMDMNRLTSKKRGSIARLRSVLGLPWTASLGDIAAVIERDQFTDREAVERLLFQITGVRTRAAVLNVLRTDRILPPSAA